MPFSLFLAMLSLSSEEDRQFMTTLYETYRTRMFRLASCYAPSPAEADDILSDSFVSLIESVDTLKALEAHQVAAYVSRTVRNTAIDHTRKQKREDIRFVHVTDDVLTDIPSPASETPIRLVEELDVFCAAMQALPETDREILRLKYFIGLSGHEIANRLGLRENIVFQHITRSRTRLKAMLYGGETA